MIRRTLSSRPLLLFATTFITSDERYSAFSTRLLPASLTHHSTHSLCPFPASFSSTFCLYWSCHHSSLPVRLVDQFNLPSASTYLLLFSPLLFSSLLFELLSLLPTDEQEDKRRRRISVNRRLRYRLFMSIGSLLRLA
jgi:hypothetical protein